MIAMMNEETTGHPGDEESVSAEALVVGETEPATTNDRVQLGRTVLTSGTKDQVTLRYVLLRHRDNCGGPENTES